VFLEDALKAVLRPLPEDALKFALGIGSPEDIVRCRKIGWEMFDCVMPTREGRHGKLFCFKNKNSPLKEGCPEIVEGRGVSGFYRTVNIGNSRFATDFSPINPKSKMRLLRRHTMAYLHHLFKINDPLGARLASLNNLEFYSDLMKKLK